MKSEHSEENNFLFGPELRGEPSVPAGWAELRCSGQDLHFTHIYLQSACCRIMEALCKEQQRKVTENVLFLK